MISVNFYRVGGHVLQQIQEDVMDAMSSKIVVSFINLGSR